jgi:membrane-bound lytic murein transglycosylase D
MQFSSRHLHLRYKILLTVVFFIVFSLCYIVIKSIIYPPSRNSISYNNNNFHVLGLNIPANLQFCGEKLPSNDFNIKKELEKEFFSSAYWKTNSMVLFNKAQRWFPYIEPILKEQGVPDDFKYLAVIESHLSNVTSPAGAAGFWQLVPITAANFGLEVNEYVDERYHVEKATRAACGHIKQAYGVFKNWTLSAAAYNRGIGGILAAMRKQHTDNYFDLLLNPETGSFVYRILAYKTLFSDPAHFGIKKRRSYSGARIPYQVIRIDTTVNDLTALARSLGTTMVTIRCFNPWLLGTRLPNPAGKVYELRLPKDRTADYSAYVKELIPEGDALVTFTKQPEMLAATEADTLLSKTIYYVVKVDEPLQNLAAFYNVKVEDLQKWNNLKDDRAVKGQTLVIRYTGK